MRTGRKRPENPQQVFQICSYTDQVDTQSVLQGFRCPKKPVFIHRTIFYESREEDTSDVTEWDVDRGSLGASVDSGALSAYKSSSFSMNRTRIWKISMKKTKNSCCCREATESGSRLLDRRGGLPPLRTFLSFSRDWKDPTARRVAKSCLKNNFLCTGKVVGEEVGGGGEEVEGWKEVEGRVDAGVEVRRGCERCGGGRRRGWGPRGGREQNTKVEFFVAKTAIFVRS